MSRNIFTKITFDNIFFSFAIIDNNIYTYIILTRSQKMQTYAMAQGTSDQMVR